MNRLISRWPSLTTKLITLASVLLLGVTLSTGTAGAQATTSGTITGTVTDPTGAVIAGATVTVTDESTKAKRSTVTNKQGQFVLVDIQPSNYDITASKTGFETDQIIGLTVSVGTQSTANFKMAVGAESTTIEVQASNADLQTLNASTGQTVDSALVDSLPAVNRDVATFVTLQPGVTPGGNVAGTTTDQATFTLDGGSNSSDMDGTQAVYTGTFSGTTSGGFLSSGPAGVLPMPQDSIEEFKVTTTGQSADFNNSSGMQAQIVTKRGRDQIHGSVYEYYLDSNIGANLWQSNFPTATYVESVPYSVNPVTTHTSYVPKASYHYSRFGATAGGPIAPYFWGGKTYLFVGYEGFRYPAAAVYERTVPSYAFLQQGQLTLSGKTYTAAQLKALDPRGIGQNATLAAYYNSTLPEAPASGTGSTTNDGKSVPGFFDSSCINLSSSYCDGTNIIGYQGIVNTPQKSNFWVARVDHDFGAKEHFMASYRYFNLQNLTSNQVDIGGFFAGDTLGKPTAVAPRPQQPWFLSLGLTTNISSTFTNDFHYSYLRNFWQWKGDAAPAQVNGASGAIEPLGENTTTVLSPFNLNAQSIRTRIWDGKDNTFKDDLSKLKGDHFIQFGGSFQHNFNYHQRTDNGASINYTPTYQIGDTGGGGNIAYTTGGLGPLTATANNARQLDTYYGFVTDTQVANTYANVGGTLTLNPPLTPFGAHSSIPYYNVYGTDTWHATPSLTVNYGLSYAIEMPPTERNGNQTMFTDVSGNAIRVDDFIAKKQIAALSGQIYNPTIGFAEIGNVAGGRKYPYDPFYTAFSPRISAAWNPKPKNEGIAKLLGNGATVIRGGYGRIYGRINGDVEVLNPLLSPGLVLATQCKYAQNSTLGTGSCTQPGFNDSTAYRFGNPATGGDGLAPVLAGAALPTTLTQPYRPGFDGPGVALASPVDPSLRPNDVDTFNLSIQRQINRKMIVEVGYIGRLIHHEYIMKDPNPVPYMLSLGGQSFEAAWLAVEGAFGCTSSQSQCQTMATPTAANIAPQPFFENALGGATSTYCTTNAAGKPTAYGSCTAAVIAKQTSAFRAQRVFSLWQALDNNVNGANGAGWTFNRSLMGTTTSNTTYGGAGQIVTGLSEGTGDGYSNYHGAYVTFKTSAWHGITAQENLTFSKALGLNAYNQSTSSTTSLDAFNLKTQYGLQPFDQKYIFNTFIVWQDPYYKGQEGIIGRAAGGWTVSPVLVAGTGQPLGCTSNNSGQSFGGMDGSNFTYAEQCVFTQKYTGGAHTHRNVSGGADPLGDGNIGTAVKVPGLAPNEVNMFTNPAAVWDTVRAPMLGLDTRNGGQGMIRGLGYLNMDLSLKKQLRIYEKYSLEFSGLFFNVMNHLDFSNPSLNIQSATAWGTTKTQGNNPRQIQVGVRASF
jgi:hypothetical protein